MAFGSPSLLAAEVTGLRVYMEIVVFEEFPSKQRFHFPRQISRNCRYRFTDFPDRRGRRLATAKLGPIGITVRTRGDCSQTTLTN